MHNLSLKTALISGTAVLALTGAAIAQEDTQELDAIQVWGTQVESDLMTLNEDQITLRQADHLSDLLRIVPGVDIGGTHSVNSRINIRGLDDRQLDVYIDGALQTNYLYHHMGNLLVNADILTAAEIEIGANSLTHGGVGGAVRFRTRNARDLLEGSDNLFGGRVMGSYADNAQSSFSLTGFGQITDQIDVLGYFHQVNRENFVDGDGRETIGSDGTTDNFLLKVGFEPTENQRFQLSYDLLEDGGEYTQRPDMGVLTNQAITGDILLPTEYARETINASYSLDNGPLFQLEATAFSNNLELTRDETNTAIRVQNGNTLKQVTADNYGYNVMATSDVTLFGFEHAFTYGVQYFDQNLSFNQDLMTAGTNIDQESQNLGIFVENEISLTDTIIVRPGLRYVDHEVSYLNTGESGSFDDVLFALATEFEPTEGLRLLASYTEIFSAPELAEPFTGAGGNKIVNPALEAESGENIEVGVRYVRDFNGGQLGLGANLFQTNLNNYIGEIAVPGTTTGQTQDTNLGSVEIQGFEASVTYAHGPWNFFITHNTSEFDTSGLNTTGVSESFREIGDTTSYEASYLFEEMNLSVAVNGQFLQDVTTSLGASKEGYNIHNIMARWDEPFGFEGLSLTGGVDNLLDEAYTSHASRSGATNHPVFGALILNDVEPGRNVKFTISQRF
ncbi:TonB-dependent receptor [Ponticaulis sp.]|uniref:TonB-dependent receptor domain-containing protein n=1 Tax=Ponticaulis sp. TaxID=2020902 RepID=UPI000C6121C6|nr:TonB-dependent receptor [Ponticaulis sp.]MBN03246.1 TonB-dependent receptor [Ponticaulis sp.]